jgi:hypothetical protein
VEGNAVRGVMTLAGSLMAGLCVGTDRHYHGRSVRRLASARHESARYRRLSGPNLGRLPAFFHGFTERGQA